MPGKRTALALSLTLSACGGGGSNATPQSFSPPIASTANPQPVATAATQGGITGTWTWQNGAKTQTINGNLPNITIPALAATGLLTIQTNVYATFEVQAPNGATLACPFNYFVGFVGTIPHAPSYWVQIATDPSVKSCQFVLVDPASGKFVLVNYTNQ